MTSIRKRNPRSERDRSLDFYRSRRRSLSYVLSSGHPGREYADFDGYYLGALGDYVFDSNLREIRLEEAVKRIIPQLVQVANECGANRLAFIEKRDDGPAGMLAMMDLIVYHSGLEGCIVRPDRRLLVGRIKGRPISPGERIMVVSDVATYGGTISRPAACLRQAGAEVPAAFVLYDRCEGARERLEIEGVALHSHWDRATQEEDLKREARELASH